VDILVLNAGSATLKFRLFQMPGENGAEAVLAHGMVDRVGTPEAVLRLNAGGQAHPERPLGEQTHAQAAEAVLRAARNITPSMDAIGHRIVHGGARFLAPTRLTPEALDGIRAVSALAPLHNPAGIAVIEAGLRLLPETPAFAVFDTAFHHTLPDVAALYALPLELTRRQELRRYGFHGISHRYVSGILLARLGRGAEETRVITCHLGNGASVCAVRDGKSVDTSMGLTPLEGLVMGTRSGDIDPGLLLHLLRALGMSASAVDDLLNHQSGLRGLSERSGDVRDLERAAAEGDGRAELALEIFAYRVRKYLGAYAAALGGLDGVAFSGGIGEHSPTMRARICRSLEFLGIVLDAERNRQATGADAASISADDSAVPLWVIPTDEELQIAREVFAIADSPLP
jgi:acetate kinase